jgi:hypothetical protein
LFVRHPSAFGGVPEHVFPGVGAFDLCPGRETTQRPMLREFLSKVLDALIMGGPYQEEEGLF